MVSRCPGAGRLELVGRDEVLRRVGVEPSGDAFNAIIFDPHTDRPFNPMVNAGAITVAGILHEVAGADSDCCESFRQ